MIKIEELKKSFRELKVLDGVSLDIPEGEITVVIGPSGTGKSVLLKHILGLIRPDSGNVYIDGKDVVSMK
ncbi:MAG: ABC transporter ATP-binding protein, partial [Deltaproteobacteria bacterium]